MAPQGFVKDLLDVADNLERALESVRQEMVDEAKDETAVKKLLEGLLTGVRLTDQQLAQVSELHVDNAANMNTLAFPTIPSSLHGLLIFLDWAVGRSSRRIMLRNSYLKTILLIQIGTMLCSKFQELQKTMG